MRTAHKIALARTAYRLIRFMRTASGESDRVLVRRAGLVWDLDLSEVIEFCVYLFGSFEKKTIQLYRHTVKAGDIVFDVGANIGSHTLPLAKLVGDSGKVIALEPAANTFQKMTRNVTLNPSISKQIVLIQALVGAPGNKTIDPKVYSSWPFESSEQLHEKHLGKLMSTEGAVALTIDDIVKSHGLTKVDLMKIDVEGHEYRVLLGAVNTLKKFKPKLITEFSASTYQSSPQEFDGIFDVLRDLKPIMTDVNTAAPLPFNAEAMRKMIPDGSSRNVFIRFSV